MKQLRRRQPLRSSRRRRSTARITGSLLRCAPADARTSLPSSRSMCESSAKPAPFAPARAAAVPHLDGLQLPRSEIAPTATSAGARASASRSRGRGQRRRRSVTASSSLVILASRWRMRTSRAHAKSLERTPPACTHGRRRQCMARSTRPCFPPHPLSPARTGHCRGPASHQARNVRNSPYNHVTPKVLGGG